MPIVTPAYPSMNSSLSVSRQTLQIMIEELVRANSILERLWTSPEAQGEANADGRMWEELFEPSDFFIDYGHYLALVIVGPNKADLQSWTGFVESRLRKLVSDQLGRSLPLTKLQLWPKKFELCCASPESNLTVAQRANSYTYFIGFSIDKYRMKGVQLNLETQIQVRNVRGREEGDPPSSCRF